MFLATWGSASDFLKNATRIQNGRQRLIQFFLWAQKLKK